MTTHRTVELSDHERAVARYYDDATPVFYVRRWNPDHIHFGLFETGECPGPGEVLSESAGLARAVERMVDVIVAPAGLRADHRVVDAGCGIGGTAIHLAQRHGCTVEGVNISRAQLGLAERKARDAGLDDRISFAYADCSRHLPFADDSVDVVVNIESACHYSDRGQFLREVRRILKPGGRIAALDWMARDGLRPGQREEYIEPLCTAWTILSLESRSTYAEKLRDAGLTVVEIDGFHGKDADNIRCLEYSYQQLFALWFRSTNADSYRLLMERFLTLSMAWREGCFELGRYCAEKPTGTRNGSGGPAPPVSVPLSR